MRISSVKRTSNKRDLETVDRDRSLVVTKRKTFTVSWTCGGERRSREAGMRREDQQKKKRKKIRK